MSNLFDNVNNVYQPLAELMRPHTLDDFIGQEHLVGPNTALRQMIESDHITSMIFWGPPGVGKTTLAKIIADKTNSVFKELSAVTAGVKDIKDLIAEAEYNKMNGHKTILFVDEIHRFNKAQQDAFLPFVERGDIILIGATTENPSFEVNSALLSRTKVYVLNSLSEENILTILKKALTKLRKNNENGLIISEESLKIIAKVSNGDARNALNTLENILNILKNDTNSSQLTKEKLMGILQTDTYIYDKDGEEHYNLISALHKSMRNSDPDAALYYLARMLEAGENPLYVARRLIRFASEDIGLANPTALQQATSAYEAAHYIGMPECNVNLAQAVVYLSLSPKSNSLYVAYEKARLDAKKTAHLKVPLHLRNAVTKLDEKLGYGKDYEYSQEYTNKITGMYCLPNEIKDHQYYQPAPIGKEKAIQDELAKINQIKTNLRNQNKN